jgi:hypothetical protein
MQLPDKRFERALQRDRLSLAALSSNLKRGKNAENVLGDSYFHGYFIKVGQSSLLQLSQVAAGRGRKDDHRGRHPCTRSQRRTHAGIYL